MLITYVNSLDLDQGRQYIIVRKNIRKRRSSYKMVQAFCEEKVLRCLLGVFWYAAKTNVGKLNKSTASTAYYPATAGGTKSYFVRHIMPK